MSGKNRTAECRKGTASITEKISGPNETIASKGGKNRWKKSPRPPSRASKPNTCILADRREERSAEVWANLDKSAYDLETIPEFKARAEAHCVEKRNLKHEPRTRDGRLHMQVREYLLAHQSFTV